MLEQKHVHLKMKKKCWLFLEKLNISWLLLTKCPVTLTAFNTENENWFNFKLQSSYSRYDSKWTLSSKATWIRYKSESKNIGKKVLIENDCTNLKRSCLNIMDVSPHQHFFVTELFLKVKKNFKIKIFFSVQMASKNVFGKMQINKSYVILEQIIMLCFKSTVRIGSMQICEF